MTNKEILQADVLDILFEHRNKLYGAYALRKTYSHRLGIALGVALSTVLLFTLMSFIKKENKNNRSFKDDRSVILVDVNMQKEEIKKPDPPKEKPKPPVATVDYQAPKIVEDDKVKEDFPDLKAIDTSNISDKNLKGDKTAEIAIAKTESTRNDNVDEKETVKEDSPPLLSRDPKFPGGPAAWLAFLQRYLQAPADVEPGERIEVQVRFWIDVDGSVSRAEITKSGGSAFDKEVLRVMKKMPKWEPALQAGRPIAVAYQQPVIFIGQEQ